MDGSHCCMDCGAVLQADDGHDLCPTCRGRDHLVEALSENPYMNSSFMPRERASDQGLATRVEQLSTELAEMKSLLQSRHSDASLPTAGLSSPPMPDLSVEEDVLSLAASASKFRDEEEAQSSPAFETGSFLRRVQLVSPVTALCGRSCVALRQLQLELPLGEVSATGSAFFRRGRAPTPFSVPLSEEYLREMHACWRDPRALLRLSTDGRVLAAMHESVKAGLDRMPAVEPAVASLIVSPDEVLRPDVRCPHTQCWVTDNLLCKAYNAGTKSGRLGNSMAHLMFALSASLQDAGGATLVDRSGWRSLLHAVGPSGVSQSCRGSCSHQQLWRRWSELFRLARLASSFLASAGVCLLLSAQAILPLARVLGRHLSMVIGLWGSIPERCGRDPAGTFVSQSAAQLDRPRILVAPTTGHPGAVGVEDATGPAVGHFFHQ
ncbi:hypothetical protein GOODEAATRI_010018 [Goodea atripinnis]|uniref:Uncharacterized protein n=1 Tax=Goodea atripinnis TaxID=208336 RepID=A0ABV0NWS1_9TELE